MRARTALSPGSIHRCVPYAFTSAGAKTYFDAHTKKFGGKEPDRWASGACWAALEILTAAVAKHGLDRKAIRDYVANNEHATILGKIKFVGSENVGTPGSVSQWQKGEFEVVWPKSVATASLALRNSPRCAARTRSGAASSGSTPSSSCATRAVSSA